MKRYNTLMQSVPRLSIELVQKLKQGDASLQIDLQKSSGSKNVLPYAKQEFIKKVEELKKVAISVPKIGISYSSRRKLHLAYLHGRLRRFLKS